MSSLSTRLQKLEEGYVCRIHHIQLTCVLCDMAELTTEEWAEVEHWLITLGIMTDAGEPTDLAAEPHKGVCQRCGHDDVLYCLACQTPRMKAEHRFSKACAALSPVDRERLDTLLRKLMPSAFKG